MCTCHACFLHSLALTCPLLTGQQAPDTEPCLPCSCASTRPHLSMLDALHMFACQLTLCVRRYLLKKAGHWWLLVTLGGIMDWCPRLSLVDSLWSGLTGPFVTNHTHTHIAGADEGPIASIAKPNSLSSAAFACQA